MAFFFYLAAGLWKDSATRLQNNFVLSADPTDTLLVERFFEGTLLPDLQKLTDGHFFREVVCLDEKNFLAAPASKWMVQEKEASGNNVTYGTTESNTFVLLFIRCTDPEQMSAGDRKKWIRKCTEVQDTPNVIKFLVGTREVLETRFMPVQEVYYSAFSGYDALLEKDEYDTDVLVAGLYVGLKDAGLTVADTLEESLREYLIQVYQDATYQKQEFIEDLIRRVRERWLQKADMSAPVDEQCIPRYNKQEKTLKPPVEEKKAPEPDRKAVPKKIEANEIFEYASDVPYQSRQESAESKNVLVLALSTFSGRRVNDDRHIQECAFWYPEEGQEERSFDPQKDVLQKYIYQMEPSLRMFHDKGIVLDELILIATQATKTPVRIVKTGTDGASVPMTFGDEGKQAISPLNYMIRMAHELFDTEDHKIRCVVVDAPISDASHDFAKTVNGISVEILNGRFEQIFFDIHGGLRQTQSIVDSSITLLENAGVAILPKNVFSMVDDGEENGTKVFKIIPAGESFRVMTFVSGMNEFNSYARSKSLEKYLNTESATPRERRIIGYFTELANAIQICEMTTFESKLAELRTELTSYKQSTEYQNHDSYLSSFLYLVESESGYGALLGNNAGITDELGWCIRKGFIQQALTLIESIVPRRIVEGRKLQINTRVLDEHAELCLTESEYKTFTVNRNTGAIAFAGSGALLDVYQPVAKDSSTLVKTSDQSKVTDFVNSSKQSYVNSANYLFEQLGYSDHVFFIQEISGKRTKNYMPLTQGICGGDDYLEQNSSAYDVHITETAPVTKLMRYKEGKKQYLPVSMRFVPSIEAAVDTKLFLRLHMSLKNERNNANHASSDERPGYDELMHALVTYHSLLKKILE